MRALHKTSCIWRKLFLRLPSLDQLATPVTGAYFLIITVLIFEVLGLAASLVGCKQVVSHIKSLKWQCQNLPRLETAEGWDDDWDE